MQRILSAVALLLVVVGVIWLLPPLATLVLVEVALLAAFLEYAEIAARSGAPLSKAPTAVAVLGVGAVFSLAPAMLPAALMAAIIGTTAVQLSRWPRQQTLAPAAAAAFSVLYLAIPFGSLAVVRITHGREALMLLLVTLMASDTAQYYGGRWLGRRPLAPAVSPGKTVEGAAFGIATAALVMGGAGAWWLPDLSAGWRIALGMLLALFGIAGDLFESTLKRGVGLKDASQVIPGHGGMLDRIDGWLFAAPVYYVILGFSGRGGT